MSVVRKVLIAAGVFAVAVGAAYVAGRVVGPPAYPSEQRQVPTVHGPPGSPSPSGVPVLTDVPAGATWTPTQTGPAGDQQARGKPRVQATGQSAAAQPAPESPAPTPAGSPSATASQVSTPTATPTPTEPTSTSTPTATPTPTETPTPSPTGGGTSDSGQTSGSTGSVTTGTGGTGGTGG